MVNSCRESIAQVGGYRKGGECSLTPVDKDGIYAGVGSTADIVEGVTGENGTGFISTKKRHGLEGWFSVRLVSPCIFRGYQSVEIPGGVCGIAGLSPC